MGSYTSRRRPARSKKQSRISGQAFGRVATVFSFLYVLALAMVVQSVGRESTDVWGLVLAWKWLGWVCVAGAGVLCVMNTIRFRWWPLFVTLAIAVLFGLALGSFVHSHYSGGCPGLISALAASGIWVPVFTGILLLFIGKPRRKIRWYHWTLAAVCFSLWLIYCMLD